MNAGEVKKGRLKFRDLAIGEHFHFPKPYNSPDAYIKISPRKYRTERDVPMWRAGGIVMEPMVLQVGSINVSVERVS